jgi:(p)ppGpp synthase/HD superfamily hydrolase
VRIIVVKLADRLHNMRTMAAMPPAKQRRIAQETLAVFAPLARLLGLYSIKEELEELSFKYALPAQYDQMRRSMSRLWDAQRPVVEAARAELQERLDNDPYLLARVEGVRVEACRKALYRQEAAEPFEQQRAAKGPRGGEGRVGRVFAPAPLVGGTATG